MCKTADALIEVAKLEPKIAIILARDIVIERRIQGESVSSEISYIAGYDENESACLVDDFLQDKEAGLL